MMSDEAPLDPGTDKVKTDLSTSIEWLRSLGVMAAALIRLAIAEISLAKEDAGRLIVSSLLIIPMLVLTWVALSVLAAWIVFTQTASVSLALAAFAAIQLLAAVILLNRIKTYRRSLTLPATRVHILAILEEIRRNPGKP
jgi:uncharacterized membrane protein YqjE